MKTITEFLVNNHLNHTEKQKYSSFNDLKDGDYYAKNFTVNNTKQGRIYAIYAGHLKREENEILNYALVSTTNNVFSISASSSTGTIDNVTEQEREVLDAIMDDIKNRKDLNTKLYNINLFKSIKNITDNIIEPHEMKIGKVQNYKYIPN